MRNLNSFILISIILFIISLVGLIKGNVVLTEPGLPVNNSAWLEYLGAAVIMLVNGIVSIKMASKHRETAAVATTGTNKPTLDS